MPDGVEDGEVVGVGERAVQHVERGKLGLVAFQDAGEDSDGFRWLRVLGRERARSRLAASLGAQPLVAGQFGSRTSAGAEVRGSGRLRADDGLVEVTAAGHRGIQPPTALRARDDGDAVADGQPWAAWPVTA